MFPLCKKINTSILNDGTVIYVIYVSMDVKKFVPQRAPLCAREK